MDKWKSLSPDEQARRFNLQSALELELEDYSINKYWSSVDQGELGNPEQVLVKKFINHATIGFQGILDEIREKVKFNPMKTKGLNDELAKWTVLLAIPADVIAGVVITQIVEDLVDSRDLRKKVFDNCVDNAYSVAYRIGKELKYIAGFRWAKETHKDDYDYLKRYVKSWKVDKMQKWVKRMDSIPDWTKRETVVLGTNMMQVARKLGIIEIEYKVKKINNQVRKVNTVTMNHTVMNELIRLHDQFQFLKMVYRPMLVPPIPHTEDSPGGVLTLERRKPTVNGRSKISPDHLNSLNQLQTTEWSINERVLEVMEVLFNRNSTECNLPANDFIEFTFVKPYPEEGTGEEKRSWKMEKEDKYGSWYKEVQKRAQMLMRLSVAKMVMRHGFFYHAYTCDFRGRAYTLTEMLSPQSGDFDRGLLQFANPCKVTREGMYWLMVHVANCCDGMSYNEDKASDKATFDDRVRWVKRQEKHLRKISEDPYANNEWMDNDTKKKNPSFQRLSAILDYVHALDTGYSSCPVQLDGSCNGSQHWSAIMRDADIGKLVNVCPTSKPGDLYQYVADIGTEICRAGDTPWQEIFFAHWEARIPRKVFKRSTMCDAYGITDHGIRRYSREEGHLNWVDDGTQKQQAVNELSAIIRQALDGALESSNDGKRYLQTLTEIVSNYDKYVEWTTPSGFKAVNRYTVEEIDISKASFYRNNRIEVSVAIDTDDINTAFAIQAIPPNFIHSIDAAHMMLVIGDMSLQGIKNYSFIHDSYGTSCNDIPVMREIIVRKFHDIHQENQLALFAKDIERILKFNIQIPLPRSGSLDIDTVLDSDYLFG